MLIVPSHGGALEPFHPLFDIGTAERSRLRALSPDHAIARAAADRDGVLTHAQLIAIGVSKAAIGRRVKRKLIFVRHRGIYAVGRLELTRRGRLRAAVLKCGRSAALSHATSGSQSDLLSAGPRIAVTVTGTPRRPARASGIELHYTRLWLPGEVVDVGGLPCTSVARTIADLAGQPDDHEFRRGWNGADRQLLLDAGALGEQIARRRRGWDRLRDRLDLREETPPTESELEDLFIDLCDTWGIRRPICQWPLGPEARHGRVDFLWLPERVAVEVDGRRWHATQEAYLHDRERELELREAGFDPHRYTYRHVRDRGEAVARIIDSALSARQRS